MFVREISFADNTFEFIPRTIKDVVFNTLPHRNEESSIIYSHIGEEFITLSLGGLREISASLAVRLRNLGLQKGDTLLLASYSNINETGSALIFTAAVCLGVRVFLPIFPEPGELRKWHGLTGFSRVFLPGSEILRMKGAEQEKDSVRNLMTECTALGIPFFDTGSDFGIETLLQQCRQGSSGSGTADFGNSGVQPEDEAVIFTTSGSSGSSKLVVYTHERLMNCCQAWHHSGLLDEGLFGNAGFSPLFTHTIGVRTFLNSIWSGNPFCMITTDWFLQKPEIVRYLLMQMKPGHVIAGPAFFNTLLELLRQFPELKNSLQHSLRAAISIGAAFDETTAAKFRSATGISMMNGFGTTETMMVALNRSGNGKGKRSLGHCLPGVTIGLTETVTPGQFGLHLRSVFQSARTIGEESVDGFFATGDLVSFDEPTGDIIFCGRESEDFIKDEYGVKIPFDALRQYYGELYERTSWIEWIPLVNMPGLAALIFTTPADEKQQKETASLIKKLNEDLKRNTEPFEFSHRHLTRFSLTGNEVPLTRKGTVSRTRIISQYAQLIAELRNPFVFNHYIEQTETGDKDFLYRFSDPHLSALLEAMKLDKVYFKAEGDSLFYHKDSEIQRVTDFAGGFGANLLGHNHPKIREAVTGFLEAGYPALNNQGSLYHYPSLLARELNRIFSLTTGKYFKVIFGNSGTEATEIATHHAWMEWRRRFEKIRDEQFHLFGSLPGIPLAETWDRNFRLLDETVPCILVADNGFHGYSSAARSLLAPKKQRTLFSGLLKIRPLRISDNDPDPEEKVRRYLEEFSVQIKVFRWTDGKCTAEMSSFPAIIASVFEPVRGEGGISAFNVQLADFLAMQDFPLISDEIQCGMGRTGAFPSYPRADYYLLGKSLGGGFEKISAVLIDDNRFKADFTKYYNSTFANGELAACAGLAVLKLITEEHVPGVAAQKGAVILSELQQVADEFPDVIESVKGCGLMTGIHFNPEMGSDCPLLRVLFENEKAGFLFAGWLLNERNIRVLPSLSRPNSLRIEPSYRISEEEIAALSSALRELSYLCHTKKIYELTRFLMNGDPYRDRFQANFRGWFPRPAEVPAAGAIKVGFIGNFTLSHRELMVLEPDFRRASDTGLRILFNKFHVLMEGKPVRIISRNLLHGRIHFTFYILPFDTSQLETVSRWGKRRFYISRIQEAVDLLSNEGVRTISLGAHTSIITGNGLNLAERNGTRILTGNTLTAASVIHYLKKHIESAGDVNKRLTLAVVGAGGNIGSGLTECLNEPPFNRLRILLAGDNEKKLIRLKDRLAPGQEVAVTSDLFELKQADIILCCANCNDPIVFPHHLDPGKPVYIIDISVPTALSPEVKTMKNVTCCKEASSVRVPGDPDLLISSHTPAGKIFCCAGETILAALYEPDVPLKGHIRRESVQEMLRLAEIENFFTD